ncbi:MAG: hypothetical protein AB7O74_02450 [Candidatus Nanopelagicales bacterium]
MRRPVFALVPALVAGLLVLAAPTAAADSTVVSKTGLPDGWTTYDARLDGRPGNTTLEHVEGPAGVPSGIGSLRIDYGDHTFKHQLNLGVPSTPAGDWQAFAFTYRSTTSLRVSLRVYSVHNHDELVVVVPPSDTWTTVDLMAGEFDRLTAPHHQFVDFVTLADMVALVPDLVVTGLSIETWGAGGKTAWIDTVTFGPVGDVTTWDFDTDPIPVITSSGAPLQVKAGASTPLSGRVARPSGDPIASLPVELWTKVWGTGTWVKDRTVLTGPSGGFTTTFAPAKQTYVQWRVNETGFATAASATRRVDVRAKVWATPASTAVGRYDRVRIFGKVAPNLAGQTVTLRRVGSSVPLATATVKADSTYGVGARLPRGTWTVYVTTSTGRGVLGGKSAGIKVTVS